MLLVVIFVTPIIVSLSLTLFYGISKMKQTKELRKTLLKTVFINLVTLMLGSIALFHYEKDGFGQVIGWGIYLGSFLIIGVVDAIVLIFYRKRLKEDT